LREPSQADECSIVFASCVDRLDSDELAEHTRIEFSTYRTLLDQLLQRTGCEIHDRAYHGSTQGAYPVDAFTATWMPWWSRRANA
jgi:hypothetical protein